MSTCTDLINAINAVVVDPNLLASIDPSTIAVLSNIGTTETAVSLGAGGPAVLSVPASPSINGVPCQLRIAGKIHTVSGGSDIGLYFGNSSTLGNNTQIFAPGSQGVSDIGFFYQASFIWDSTSQNLKFSSTSVDIQGISSSGSSPSNITGISNQTSIQFVVSGKFSANNSASSVTITEFKIVLL